MAKKLTKSIKEQSDVHISVGRVSLSYLGKVKLNDVYIEDHHQDTLINVVELKTSILSLSNLINNTPRLGSTTAKGFTFNMVKYQGEETDNLGVFLEKLKTEPTGKKKSFELFIRDIYITDGSYSFINENLNNPEMVILENLDLQAENLKVAGSDVSVSINALTAQEGRGLDITNLKTEFSYSPTEMHLDGLFLETPSSTLDADINLVYVISDFSDFENKVAIEGVFRESRISTNDLKVFYEPFGEDQTFVLNSKITGTLNDFILEDLEMKGLDRSSIDGTLHVVGAFADTEEFRLEGNLENLSSNYYDLVNLLPSVLGEVLPVTLRDFGNLQLQGIAVITTSMLDVNVFIKTQLGSAKADIVLSDFSSSTATRYKGNLVFNNFNIGRFLNKKELGKTSFDINIDGKGFTAESLNTNVRGRISSLTYNDYRYTGILVMGMVRNSIFNGNLVSQDPNLRMEFNGLLDISQQENIYDFEASVGYANLHELNFVTRDSLSILKGDIIMNMQGNSLDNVSGNIYLLNATYQNPTDLYYFDDLSITSEFDEEGIRTIAVSSPDVISGQVTGNFKISEVGSLVENSIGSIYTNYRPNTITTNQYMEFDFDIYNKIVEIFYPEITLAPNTFIRGRVESDESEFRLTFRSPRIEAFGNMMEGINIQVDNTNPLYNTFVEADSVATSLYNFSEFNLINVTLRDTLFIRSEFQGGKRNDDVFNINLFHTINEDNNSVVGIQRSDVKFKDNMWYLNENSNKSNKIVFSNSFRDLTVDSLVLSHQNEMIRLSGEKRDSTYKNFRIEFDEVDIGKITPEIDSLELGGILNGRLNLLQEQGAFFPNTSLTIDGLAINEIPMGRLTIDVNGNENLTFYNIDATLMRKGFESLSAIGEIDATGEDPLINLDVALQNINLSAFSPLGGEAIDNIRGFASGEAKVTGDYRNPDINGQLELEDAYFRIPYLNIDYNLENTAIVDLTEQRFNFNNVKILDTKYQTTVILTAVFSTKILKAGSLTLKFPVIACWYSIPKLKLMPFTTEQLL
ncbi:hypothetical protein LZ575_02740 [Antarcticibacterium sp. 1MA-6-2]|uniref:hypothetical protein n=1 Tax=Antarcticibacterium sp. 1MA-6-2 TaxID=2908210 RepID=UPI001F1DFFC2|nr:hypothetical protein [Antarcticibacterium sp. 1MA-6-2]UJH91631.1 hypothetical protein LZ575_02740 [Antarcticibacterium sp. 1MA-6-2]